MTEKKDDSWIQSASELLTWKAMVKVGVKWMGFSVTRLVQIEENTDDLDQAKIFALTEFKNKQNNPKQRLAYYLTQSGGLVDSRKVEEKLGEIKPCEKCEPKSIGKFPADVLVKLADVIPTSHMESIALSCLEFDTAQVKNTRFANIKKADLFSLAILENYAMRKNTTLKDLKEKLQKVAKEHGYFDGNEVTKILDEAIKDTVTDNPKDEDAPDSSMADVDVESDLFKKKKRKVGPTTTSQLESGHDAEEIYNVNRKSKSFILILNNEKFDNTEMNREGTKSDSAAIKKAFERSAFLPIEISDLRAKFMAAVLEAFANKENLNDDMVKLLKKDLHEDDKGRLDIEIEKFQLVQAFKDTNCLIVAIMSHGTKGNIYGTDGNEVSLDDIFNHFNNDNCPELAGKPKLFLIQACRGDREDLLLKKNLVKPDSIPGENGRIPRYADMLLGFATNPGLVSYRRCTGSIFIQAFCKVVQMETDKHKDGAVDMLSATTKINQLVAKEEFEHQGREQCQMSEFHSTLTRKWLLYRK